MEKRYEALLQIKYQEMLQRIVNATRSRAQTVPKFRDSGNGCIRITIAPLSDLAESWLGGGLSDFSEGFSGLKFNDVCEREWVFPIRPGGSHTILWTDPNDGHTEHINCYAFSAMKIAFMSWWRRRAQANDLKKFRKLVRKLAEGDIPHDLKHFTAENGWAANLGVTCTTVKLDHKDFIRLYVCVSGADEEDDEACALAGMMTVEEFFSTEVCRLTDAGCFKVGEDYLPFSFSVSPDFINLEEA